MLDLATRLALGASGIFMIIAIVTGGWKYRHIRTSPDHKAPAYVNIAHQASLAYAFSSLIVSVFAQLSYWHDWINVTAVILLAYQFFFATTAYVIHGYDVSMTNQFAPPHKLGRISLSPSVVHMSMVLLLICELGGFVVLFSGFLTAQFI